MYTKGKKLKNIGGDLGSAVKGFKKSIDDSADKDKKKEEILGQNQATDNAQSKVKEDSNQR